MKSILLVEDSPEDIFFMQRALKKAGVLNPLQIAEDGQKAMDYLNGSGLYGNRLVYPLPGLVLLDLKIPFVKGLEVLKWIRSQADLAQMIVIVFTSSGLDNDITHAYSLGANSYSIKPSASEKLAEFSKALKDYWLQHDLACLSPVEK
ncbi:two-component system, unclassified family, response regulator [Verrucomicrobium sp. GAS474]|uniref:response regulator n=1 Tax=Verrucomicrobium sp. GAS474 TaxID=1882831 RepID=UPI00087A6EAF|nr:response regulator [Verrucomicrobium sp. GAS474]SDT97329.1 two-component system, unclassified family, response regulator [Verrucomicrobium sp. GAS474]